MERLTRAREQAVRAYGTLEEVLSASYSTIVRDASIQRFGYTFETTWKLLIHDGIDAGSPKACIREAFKSGFLNEEQTTQALLMTDDRNLTSHTYIESVAELVFSRIPEHSILLKKIMESIP